MTNARSLSPKIVSLQDAFEAHELDFALVTESWLKDGSTLDRDVVDLEYGTGLKILYKNRPRRAAGARSVGGGVSIVYRKDKCNFREHRISDCSFELLVALGRVSRVRRTIAIFCLYIEPKMKAADLRRLRELIADVILQIKAKHPNPLVLVGGDMNRRDIGPAFEAFSDIEVKNFEPTRGNACLDVVYGNFRQTNPVVYPPLETLAGVPSDHACVVFNMLESKERNFVWVKKTARKHTEQAVEEFGQRFGAIEWNKHMSEAMLPDQLVEVYEGITSALVDELFPLKTVRIRSNEPPWITDGTRRLARRMRRVYKAQKKSAHWKRLRFRHDQMINASKMEFVAKAKSGGAKNYFNSVKSLSSNAAPSSWDVTNLFPDSSPSQAGDAIAEYFTKISDTFEPLAPSRSVEYTRRPISLDDVKTKLRQAKKPNSSVPGDLLPRLMKRFHHLVATPAWFIFNSVFRCGEWPSKWKEETAVIIPKTSNPNQLSECRNISCTPFLSKVLESVLLEDLRSELQIDEAQYGGIKNSSVDHLLVDLYDAVLEPLDAGDPSLVVSIDFEKAFNRLNHAECLRQLRNLGASDASIALVRSFLTNRSMRVRVGSILSSPRLLKGGSPQGSILGCLLYCAATQQLDLKLRHNTPTPPTPALLAPQSPVPPSPTQGVSDQVGMRIQALAVPGNDLSLSGSSSTDDSFLTAESASLPPTEAPALGESKLVMFKYIDDTTVVETVPKMNTTKHFSTSTTLEDVPATATSNLMSGVVERAGEIGMLVNGKKTQAVCISANNGCKTTSRLTVAGSTVVSSDRVKLLGFMLGARPGVHDQVAHIKDKFRRSFWSIINLYKAGMRGKDLFQLYTVFVRSVIETNSVVYHPMLTKIQSEQIERLQKLVTRLCFGFHKSYTTVCQEQGVETLKTRRKNAVQKFAMKSLKNPRFGPRWFVPRPDIDRDLRRRDKYIVPRATTNRYQRSPLQHLRTIANSLP